MSIQLVVSSLIDSRMVDLKGIHLVRDMVREAQDQLLSQQGVSDGVEYRDTECEDCDFMDHIESDEPEEVKAILKAPHWHFEASGWSKL